MSDFKVGYLENLFGLKGKVAAITGGSGLLCSEMSRGLAKSGCSILVIDTNQEAGKALVSEIKQDGGAAVFFQAEVTRKKDFEQALSFCLTTFGRIDILINGAGINAPTPFLQIGENEWDSILAVHLKGVLFGCQVFGGQMLKQKNGSIINISSAAAGPPLSKAFAYSAAKSGVRNLTQNIAREWATQGVRVNAIRPGFFPTEWSRKNFITAEREASILNHTPMKRYGNPHELLGAVLWLASDAATFVTGAEIAVDGGFTAMTI